MRQKLEGGFINEVFRQDGVVWKHFIGENLVGQPAVSRKLRELHALKRFGGQLAPQFCGFDGRDGLYQEYLTGPVLETIVDALSATDFIQVGQLLRAIHQPVNNPPIYTLQRLKNLEQHSRFLAQPLLDCFDLNVDINIDYQAIADLGITRVHRDYWLGNIIATPQGLRAIDWEFAGIGSPYEDFAIVDLWIIREYTPLHPDIHSDFYSGYGLTPDPATITEFLKLKCLQFLATTTVEIFESEPADGFYHNKVNLLRLLT